jgi:hypothetical protein
MGPEAADGGPWGKNKVLDDDGGTSIHCTLWNSNTCIELQIISPSSKDIFSLILITGTCT